MIQIDYYAWMYSVGVRWGIWFIIGLLIAIWMYRDAQAEGENPKLWFIIGLLLGIIGLIIWLFYKRE